MRGQVFKKGFVVNNPPSTLMYLSFFPFFDRQPNCSARFIRVFQLNRVNWAAETCPWQRFIESVALGDCGFILKFGLNQLARCFFSNMLFQEDRIASHSTMAVGV